LRVDTVVSKHVGVYNKEQYNKFVNFAFVGSLYKITKDAQYRG